ncbi:flagellar filament capping protein FliD [Neobacillus niacini]|uniref:flagellar filament capping protein FliD n=1 Tax=Neobacillus niacini TaxID=86668 RepID=UPI0007AB439D|nr:flagellar filament capping protein FliD [Neobacillus niacini]MEC1522162.1 flagellar filament capping protein FliD [Neobacillus niacini]
MNYSSITRLTGFASGMDTDSIVKKLMNAESISLNKLKQNQQKQTWLSDSYRQWNADLLAFRSNTILNMSLSKTYNTFDVSSSQENAVSATASGTSLAGTYSVEVKQLASSAAFTGDKVSLDPTKTLGNSVQGAAQLTADTSITINVNNDPGKTATIAIKTTDTINDVVTKINGAKDSTGKSLGLQAFYDPTLQQFTLKTKETGAAAKIDLSMNTSAESQAFLNNTLGLNTTNLVAAGQNANVIFNGNEITTLPSNNATIMGINFSFKSPTVGASTVTVSQNTDGVIKNVKDFVDQYNSMLDKMNKSITDPVYRDYQPLLEEQKGEMSEKQIEMWEEKAKSGLLRSDRILSGLVTKMRSVMTSIVDNGSSYNSLSSIGISSRSYQDKGKLYVDETKLREAIQADPDAVEKLFSQLGDASKGTSGVINQLSETLQAGIKELTNKAGFTGNNQYDQSVIGKLLSNAQTDIARQTEKLQRKEAQYYRQFAAMEQAMSRFNSQSSWLYQQTGGGM